jgi:hypothetical protein
MPELKIPYKKRTKTKESNGISSLLHRHTDRGHILGQFQPDTVHAKKKMLGDAYYFAVVNKAIDEIFQSEFPKLVDDLKLCEIFVKHNEDIVKITIQSGDISFLAWLKTECEHIREKLMEVLVTKKLLKSENEIFVVGKRK